MLTFGKKTLHATFLHTPRPADSDSENSSQLAAPTNENNQQKCVQYARYIIPGTLALLTQVLKIHQNTVFYIPTRTAW